MLNKKVSQRLGSAKFFDKSNFPALFSDLIRTEKSAGYYDLSNIRADPSRFNMFSPLRPKLLPLIACKSTSFLLKVDAYTEEVSRFSGYKFLLWS